MPSTRPASGLVKTSSVGRLAQNDRPVWSVSRAASQRVLGAMPDVERGAGAAQLDAVERQRVERLGARAPSAARCRAQASGASSGASRQKRSRSSATARAASSGSSSG